MFSKPTDLNGSASGWYDANVVTSGDVFIQKRVSDTDSFEQRLSTDQSAYPSAEDPDGDNVVMDRVAITNSVHAQQPIIFTFVAPQSFVGVPHKFANFHFNGPAGAGKKWKGSGRYQISFFGDGKCILYEKVRFDDASTDEWMPVHRFQYSPAYSVAGQAHRVEIRPIPAGKLINAPYGAIVFNVKVDEQSTYHSGPGSLAAGITKKPGRTAASCYLLARHPKRYQANPPTPINVPARVDIRRDQRVPFQITKMVYRTSGYLIDDPFALDFLPSQNLALKVYAIGSTPTGTSLTARLFNAETDAEISVTSTSGNLHTFTIPARIRHYYVRWDFAGTADATPILEGYQIVMDAVIDEVTPGEFESEGAGLDPGSFMSVSITGGEADPSHESMRVELHDLRSSLSRLSVRGEMLAQLDVGYDPEDAEKVCTLFRGYMVDNKGKAKGNGTATGLWPDRNWKSYDLTFMGVWKRLSEALSSVRFDWHGPDPNAPVGIDGIQPPFKATEAISTMLQWAGFPTTMISIPESDIRLYPSTTNDLFIEPLTNLSDYIVRIARDYLAMWLTFDPNAGTHGKWTVLPTPTAPYTNKATFVDVGPNSKLSHMLSSYPTDPPTAFIEKGTLEIDTKKLEANRLVVTGTGILAGAPPDLKLLTQVAYNFKSCNFFGLDESHAWYPDPDHPDYIGYDKPLYIVDPSLQTPEAVNIVTRRVFDVACLSTRVMSFMAPLIFVDHDDEEGRKRPLRFYDPVTVTRFGADSQWLVRNVNPVIGKDHIQMAIYELEAPREPFLPEE
jgi:hypothetical protein